MKNLLLKRALKLSVKNIWRNKFLSLATILVMGITIFIFNIIYSVNIITQNAIEDLSKKIDIVVYLKETTTAQEAQNIAEEIKKLNTVEKVKYQTKEEALKSLEKTHPDLTVALNKYDLNNPLPASLNITTNNPKNHKNIEEFLNQEKYKKYLTEITTNSNSPIISSVSQNLTKVSQFTNQLVYWLIIIFLIGGTLIIINAIQITIFSRKKEIEVMKLVGASYNFIRIPFIIECIIYGILATTLSYAMMIPLQNNIQLFDININKLFIIELIITITLSTLSSLVAIHKHLHTKTLQN